MLQIANEQILACARGLPYAELARRFERKGVWHCLVRSPGQALAYPQALAAGCWCADTEGRGAQRHCVGGAPGAGRRVAAPVHFA